MKKPRTTPMALAQVRLSKISAEFEDRGCLPEKDICFLLRMADQYLNHSATALEERPRTEREDAALAWLLDTVDSEPELIPGSVYAEYVDAEVIGIRIQLPPGVTFSDDVVNRDGKVLESHVKRAVRTMLFQSGFTDLPDPVDLIPEHPSDSEAARLIRRAAALIDSRHQEGDKQ